MSLFVFLSYTKLDKSFGINIYTSPSQIGTVILSEGYTKSFNIYIFYKLDKLPKKILLGIVQTIE